MTSNHELVELLLHDRPLLHDSETEVRTEDEKLVLPSGSGVNDAEGESGAQCWGIGGDVLHWLVDEVKPGVRTLETGSGISTIVLAACGAIHTAVTPSSSEAKRILEYARARGLGMGSVRFISQPSEEYLPTSVERDLDVVLIDGKHAFPWPIIDWFYLADKIAVGGILLVDDIGLKPVSILTDFLHRDSRWIVVRSFKNTTAYRKVDENVLNVAWYMQEWVRYREPYLEAMYALHSRVFRRYYESARRLVSRFIRS